jgi:rhamnosyltransferase subunit B
VVHLRHEFRADSVIEVFEPQKIMANILLTAMGTGGDLIPFLNIGAALRIRGHRVTLITHGTYHEAAKRRALEFVPLDTPAEYEAMLHEIVHPFQDIPRFFRKHAMPRVMAQYTCIQEQYRPGETVLVACMAPGLEARLLAETLAIPYVFVGTTHLFLNTFPLYKELYSTVLARDINQLRAQVGLSSVRDWDAFFAFPPRSLGLWPEWFAPPQAGWPEGVELVGFHWHEGNQTDDVPPAVQELLAGGERPILITGGTSAYVTEFHQVAVQACQRLGRQTLLVTRHERVVPHPLPPNVHWYNYLPLSAVMPHVEAVIHHGGLGTLSNALAAGIPQLALTVGGDRPYNGLRLQQLGVGEFLPWSQWQPDIMADILRRLIGSPGTRERCQELARRVLKSDPMNAACSVIESLIPHRELPVQPRPPRPINAASPPLASSEQSNAAMIRSLMANLSPEKQAVLELRLQQKLTRSTGNDSASKVPQRDGKSESANLDRGAVSRLTALREQSIPPRWNMIHAGRCGSTLLGLLLDNHPKIAWDGELFVGHWGEFEKRARERGENTSTRWNSSKYYPNDPIRYIQSCAEVFPSRQYGFSIKLFHLEFLNLAIEDYLQRVTELGFVHNVVLERKNLLRVVVSALVAEAKGVYHLWRQKSELRPIHLDVNNVEIDSQARPLLDFLATYEQQYRALATASGAHHTLWLVYEEDIAKDPLRAYRRCCEFLEVDPHPVSIPAARTTPFPLSEVLMNFDEVAASLKGTRFEWMLSD